MCFREFLILKFFRGLAKKKKKNHIRGDPFKKHIKKFFFFLNYNFTLNLYFMYFFENFEFKIWFYEI